MFVGPLEETTGDRTYTFSSVLVEGSAVTLCLYEYSDSDQLLAQTNVTLNSQPPTPVATPTPVAPAPTPVADEISPVAPKLSSSAARAKVATALRDEHRAAFRGHRRFTRSCSRLGRHRIRCRAGWVKGQFRYSAIVTLRNDLDDPPVITWSTSIKRKRIPAKPHKHHAPAPPSRPAQPSCEPGYSPCLKPNVSDYDCAGGSGNGPYYVEGPVYVTGSDPYDLDRDGDGVACES